MLGLAGIGGGLLLGELVAGDRLRSAVSRDGSYSDLSANPDALNADASSPQPCFGCADSYGVGSRMRAERERQDASADDAFRELGSVELSWPVPEPEGDYSYGGRFPDPDASEGTPAAAENSTPAPATGDVPPAGEPPAVESL